MESGIWGLQILPAGIQLDNPSELFGSPGMQPVLDQLRLLADIVLLDTPPVLVVPGHRHHRELDPRRGGRGLGGARPTGASWSGRCTGWSRPTAACSGVALNRVRRASASSYQAYTYKQ